MEEIKVATKDIPKEEADESSKTVVREMGSSSTLPSISTMPRKTLMIFAGVIIAGILTGFVLFKWRTTGTVRLAGSDVEVVQTPTEEGVKDASTFRDTATGTLIENDGKLTDEGTHVLTRGDASQNVYLTSSVIDMSKYVGKKVQVWGETFEGQKAGWLMDVGRIKLVQ